MSAEPLTSQERFDRLFTFGADPDDAIVHSAKTVRRYEATVQAETARADAAEVRAERLAETIRWARSRALRHDEVLVHQLTEVLAAYRPEGER